MIEKGDQRAARLADAAVARRTGSAVVLTDQANPRVRTHHPLDDHSRVVHRAVVDHDDLEVLEGLGECARQRRLDELRGVIRGRQDAHARHPGTHDGSAHTRSESATPAPSGVMTMRHADAGLQCRQALCSGGPSATVCQR